MNIREATYSTYESFSIREATYSTYESFSIREAKYSGLKAVALRSKTLREVVRTNDNNFRWR